MSRNGKKTIGTELMEQLDGNPIEFLTTPMTKSNKTFLKKTNGMNKNLETQSERSKGKMSQEKERMTVQINKNTIERVKDCVYWNRLTVTQFVEEALKAALMAAEKQNGKTFEKRRSELKPGRPTK